MPLRSLLEGFPTDVDDYLCTLQERWGISRELAARLVCLAGNLAQHYPVYIISGFRDPETQRELKAQGRPAADPDVSTHCSCPATGADLWPSVTVTEEVKLTFGMIAEACGLRWGGGSPRDTLGIPSDWNHVDLGRRIS